MKKRILLFILAALMLLTMAACGKKGIEGKWGIVSDESGEFSDFTGMGYEFYLVFDKGTMSFDFNLDNAGLSDEDLEMAQAMLGMMNMYTMTYKIISDTEMELSVDMMGESDTETVHYTLNGDTLEIEGTVFKRQ